MNAIKYRFITQNIAVQVSKVEITKPTNLGYQNTGTKHRDKDLYYQNTWTKHMYEDLDYQNTGTKYRDKDLIIKIQGLSTRIQI